MIVRFRSFDQVPAAKGVSEHYDNNSSSKGNRSTYPSLGLLHHGHQWLLCQ